MQALSAANIVKKMKLKFTKAWLSFLRLPLPLDVYKEVRYVIFPVVMYPLKINEVCLDDRFGAISIVLLFKWTLPKSDVYSVFVSHRLGSRVNIF